MKLPRSKKISVIIPCFKVKNKILSVIKKIGKEVNDIYIVDDCCPENTGSYVKAVNKDKRIKIITNSKNMGVGQSTMNGFKQAFIIDKSDICVKIDGDGQMNPKNIMKFCDPIIKNKSNYTKGNRFFFHKEFLKMPVIRMIGNLFLSIFGKISTGQYSIFDVTNGFIAINRKTYMRINWKKISKGFFFETDILVALRLLKIKATDVFIKTRYFDEKSNLKIKKIFFEFLIKNILIFINRLKIEYIKKKKIKICLLIINIPLSLILSIFNYEYFIMTIIMLIMFLYFDARKI